MFLSALFATKISLNKINSRKQRKKPRHVVIYSVNVVMRHPKRAKFLNPVPNSF